MKSAGAARAAGLAREGILRRYLVFPSLGPEPRDCRSDARVRSPG